MQAFATYDTKTGKKQQLKTVRERGGGGSMDENMKGGQKKRAAVATH